MTTQPGVPAFDLTGRVALLTGASSGFGARWARLLAAAGASVVLCARRAEQLEVIVAEITASGGQAIAVATDVTDEASIKAAYDAAEAAFGPVDTILANAGVGAASHLCGLLLMKAVDAPMTTVPFRGTGPAMQELLAGRVDLMCDQTTNTTEQILGHQVKVFSVTTQSRIGALPNVPTSAEAGLPAFEVTVWHGLYAPRATPPEIVNRLSHALQAALRDPRLVARFRELGTEPVAQDRATPAAHRAFWLGDIAKWRPIIQAAGQYAD